MSRRNRLLVVLSVILIVLGLAYAVSPWLLTTVIRQHLAAQGLRDIALRLDYPNWHGLQLHAIAFTTAAGGNHLSVKIPDVDIRYGLTDLITGRVERVHVPLAEVQAMPTSPAPFVERAAASAPPAALFTGQWLTQLPIHELNVDEINARWQPAKDTIYTLQSHLHLLDGQLDVQGDIHLSSPPASIAFQLQAKQSGETQLHISRASNNTTTPLVNVAVTSVQPGEPLQINGELQAQLSPLTTFLLPWFAPLQALAITHGELTSQWHAQLQGTEWAIDGNAAINDLRGRWTSRELPATQFNATYRAEPSKALLRMTLAAAAQAVTVQGEGTYDFDKNTARADLKLTPVSFSESGFILSQLLPDWPYPFDVNAGRVSAGVQLAWDKVLTAKLGLTLDQLGGRYNKITFKGLKGDVTAAMDKAIATSQPVKLHVDNVDVGFPVQNIAAQFGISLKSAASPPVVNVQTVTADLLGGKVHSGPFVLDFSRKRNTFLVRFEQLDLNEIMRLEHQEGLEGSGRLDGQIPITLTHEGVAVTDGKLNAQAPGGVIRYTPTDKVAALAQSNTGVKVAVDALSNFQYHLMEVRSDYHTKGDLKLQVHLEGKNPDWQAGKPVHLNLNLQENIPTLLRSLQLSSDITEKVRKHYQKSP
ncbi:MAG: hypothetical protein GC149_12320 [Gammaproteobacteria bacterium]|nr:hypothetical protein [Gammaproteobacteria bacterium]